MNYLTKTSEKIKSYFSNTDKISDTVINIKENTENLVKNIPQNTDSLINNSENIIMHNISHLGSKLNETGHKIIENAQKNPKAYIAGAALATLIAGITIGRVSKNNDDNNGSKSL